MTKFYYYLLGLFLPVLLSNCVSPKKMVYFQGPAANSETNKSYSVKFQPDDLLSIYITGIDPETVKPFNLPTLAASTAGGYEQGAPTPPGYLIDSDGNIEFPMIGKFKMAGLTRKEATDSLKSKLKPFLTNPNVIIKMMNFKVTVLGEVHKPGTFTIPNERITLPEALGIAGDLSINGRRRNILVVRDVDGKKTEYRIDLTSKKVFESPVYYLNQNDLVYVEPNRTKLNASVFNPNTATVLINATSILITIILLLRAK
jgi:polysaccharide export outer membrane protein